MTISEFAVSKIGCGYVYGATGWICNPTRRQEQAAQYPEQANNCLVVAAKWDGKQCFDCAQLVKKAAEASGISGVPSGANNQWNADIWSEKHIVSENDTPTDPDTIVFRMSNGRMNHVGVYIGNGYVVEAKGAAYGVVKTAFSTGKWTHFGILKAIAEKTESTETVTSSTVSETNNTAENAATETNAVVIADKGSTVNLRDKPNGKLIVRVPIGASVKADEEENWTKVTYQGKTGWMMSKFISKGVG